MRGPASGRDPGTWSAPDGDGCAARPVPTAYAGGGRLPASCLGSSSHDAIGDDGGRDMPGVTTRLVSMTDVPELTALAVANREFLAPTNPATPDQAYTPAGQEAIVEVALTRHANDLILPHVILDVDGSIAGRINLNSISRGAAQCASVGYWVAQDRNGRGIATAAVSSIVAVGFTELGLHRVQGETFPHNTASQIVLARNGFERIGYAPQFLRIAGQWQDHVLYQRLNEGDRRGGTGRRVGSGSGSWLGSRRLAAVSPRVCV